MRLQEKSVNWLKPHPDNYLEHTPEQIQHIAQSLREFNQYKNIVALEDGTVLAGHGVVAAAMSIGMPTLQVEVVDYNEAKARKLMVADNETRRGAISDDLQLAELLRSVHYDGGLEGTGFDEDSLNELLAEVQTGIPTGVAPSEEEPGPSEPLAEPAITCPSCGHVFSGQVAGEVRT